jgi:hypothetical protein
LQVFGEDALLNISVEREASGLPFSQLPLFKLPLAHGYSRCAGTLAGAIRIRAKTQGIALSLGDRVTAKQKGN